MATTHPVETIAKLLILTERRVQQLAREGILPKADHGRYELVPVVQAYVKYLRDRAIGADTPGEDGDHKRRQLRPRPDRWPNPIRPNGCGRNMPRLLASPLRRAGLASMSMPRTRCDEVSPRPIFAVPSSTRLPR